jgi:hypothetical protein
MSRISVIFCAQIPWIIALFLLLPSNVSAWNPVEHQALGNYSLGTLRNDGYRYLVDAMQATDQDGFTLQAWFLTGEHDADLNDLSRNHYYDPVNGEGLWGFKSAAVDGPELFNDAIGRWQQGDVAGAMYLLGQSVHVLQDMAVPFHTHLDPLDGHTAYEDWALNRTSDFSVNSGGNYNLSTPFAYISSLATESYPYYDSVENANGTDASCTAAVRVLEPLAIRYSAGMLLQFFQEIEGQRPVVSAAQDGMASAGLYWTPSTEKGFVRYDVYVSSPGKDLVWDGDHLVRSIVDRSTDNVTLTGLTSYGQYQVQVVTVLSNGSLASDVVTIKLGTAQYIAAGVLLGMVSVAVIIGILYNGRDGKRKTKRR